MGFRLPRPRGLFSVVVLTMLVSATIGRAAPVFKLAGDDVWIELTTPAQIAAHEARAIYNPLYGVAEMVTYILLL